MKNKDIQISLVRHEKVKESHTKNLLLTHVFGRLVLF